MTDFYHYDITGDEPSIGTILITNMHMYKIIGVEKRDNDTWRVTAELMKMLKKSTYTENNAKGS